MKTTLLLLSLALTSGCCWRWPCGPQGVSFGPHVTPSPCYGMVMAGQAIVNNSGVLLDIFQDGVLIGRNMGTGQVLPIRPALFQSMTVVVVTGHDGAGAYLGSDKHIFNYNVPEAWSVNRLVAPKTPQ